MTRVTSRRVARLGAREQELRLRGMAQRMAIKDGRSVKEVLAEVKPIAVWLARDEAQHPRRVVHGQVDLEPILRRWAEAEGLDPAELIAEAGQLIRELDG